MYNFIRIYVYIIYTYIIDAFHQKSVPTMIDIRHKNREYQTIDFNLSETMYQCKAISNRLKFIAMCTFYSLFLFLIPFIVSELTNNHSIFVSY